MNFILIVNNINKYINIPIALAKVGLKIMPKEKRTVNGGQIDINEIFENDKVNNSWSGRR